MRIPLFLLLALFTQIVFSQRFTADLSKLELNYPRSSTFSVDSVIDARSNKEILGYITNKKGKFHSTVFPSEELSTAILTAYNATKNQIGDEKLILRINRLFIYETTQNEAKFFNADLNVSFILKTDSQLIERFTAAKMILFRANHGNHFVTPLIGELLDTCLLQYEKRKRAGKLVDKVISTEQLTQAPNSRDKKIITKRGLYYSFYDLRDNIIDTMTTFSFEKKKTSEDEPIKVKLRVTDDKVSWRDVYAFSDGQDAYINIDRIFTQLTDSAGNYWLDFYPGYNESNQYASGIIVSGFLGGVIGVGIYALIESLEKTPAFLLDFERGMVVPSEYMDSDKMSAETYICGSSFLKDSDTLSVSLNDSLHLRLGKNQYFLLKSDYRCSPIKVCISANGNTACETIQPILFKRQVVRCSSIKGKKLRITEIYGSERQGELYSIESGRATQVLD